MSAVISDMPDTRMRTKDMPNARPINRLATPGVLTPVLTTRASSAPNATITPPTRERIKKAHGCAAFSTAMAATRSTIAPTVSGSKGSSGARSVVTTPVGNAVTVPAVAELGSGCAGALMVIRVRLSVRC